MHRVLCWLYIRSDIKERPLRQASGPKTAIYSYCDIFPPNLAIITDLSLSVKMK